MSVRLPRLDLASVAWIATAIVGLLVPRFFVDVAIAVSAPPAASRRATPSQTPPARGARPPPAPPPRPPPPPRPAGGPSRGWRRPGAASAFRRQPALDAGPQLVV